MTKPTEPTPSLYCVGFETDWFEAVLDDRLSIAHIKIDNGDFNQYAENEATVRVLESSAPIDALVFGGVVVFSNVPKRVLSRAMQLGLEYLLRSGQIRREDLLSYVQPEEADSKADAREDPPPA